MTSEQLTPFGAPMRKHFLFDPDWRNLNQGTCNFLLYRIYNLHETFPPLILLRLVWDISRPGPRRPPQVPGCR